MKTLATIKSVEFIKSDELTLYPKKHIIPGDTISAIADFIKLNLTEPAQSETTPEPTENGLRYTTKVSGFVYDEDDYTTQNIMQVNYYCYRLTDVYGNKYLIGIDKSPYPEIIFRPRNEATPGGNRSVAFEITWISTLPPLVIVDL